MALDIGFDIDWLADAASQLVGRNISVDPARWRLYNSLWLEVLHAIYKNNQVPVLFALLDERDFPRQASPAWRGGINWLLLDCDDAVRRHRLLQRHGWTDTMVEDALNDARVLCETAYARRNTGELPPSMIADQVVSWLERTQGRMQI